MTERMTDERLEKIDTYWNECGSIPYDHALGLLIGLKAEREKVDELEALLKEKDSQPRGRQVAIEGVDFTRSSGMREKDDG